MLRMQRLCKEPDYGYALVLYILYGLIVGARKVNKTNKHHIIPRIDGTPAPMIHRIMAKCSEVGQLLQLSDNGTREPTTGIWANYVFPTEQRWPRCGEARQLDIPNIRRSHGRKHGEQRQQNYRDLRILE